MPHTCKFIYDFILFLMNQYFFLVYYKNIWLLKPTFYIFFAVTSPSDKGFKNSITYYACKKIYIFEIKPGNVCREIFLKAAGRQ